MKSVFEVMFLDVAVSKSKPVRTYLIEDDAGRFDSAIEEGKGRLRSDPVNYTDIIVTQRPVYRSARPA